MERYVTNLQVLTDDQAEVVLAVNAQVDLGPTLVGQARAGWVGVYPAALEMHVSEECEAAAAALSRQTGRVVLALMLHAGDALLYWLAEGGEVIDRYCSDVSFLIDLAPQAEQLFTGDPQLLAQACGLPEAGGPLGRMLARAFPGDAEERLLALARTLGILGVEWSYEDLLAGAAAPLAFVEAGRGHGH